MSQLNNTLIKYPLFVVAVKLSFETLEWQFSRDDVFQYKRNAWKR